MAKFEYDENGDAYISLKAEAGEEISVDMTQAWAGIRIASALEYIADRINELAAAVENSGPV